ETVTALDMARAVSRVAGFGGEILPLAPQAFRDLEGWPPTLDFLWSVQVDSRKAREQMGWTPARPGLLAELDSLAGADVSAIYPAPRYAGAAPSTMPGEKH
ncbi:MAG TPA: hypothetical protein VFH92_10395, partial [Phenylobacterium sp.]|nr:hypothetical protein [Phenylobacterium sp.]